MSEKIYTMITEKIQEQLEKGNIPWNRPWHGGGKPQNLVSKKAYRGINTFLLTCSPYSSPYWLTYKQAQEKGGSVKKGEKSTPVIFWKWLEVEDKETGKQKKIPFLRYYNVFNVEQCEGINNPDNNLSERPFNPIESCEKIVDNMPKRPPITHNEARAYYRPLTDSVNMPKKELFKSDEEYYSTLFHELTHSTGHESRCNRELSSKLSPFGSQDYGKEELVAEMGAAFLCGMSGIEKATIENSAAYIQGWLKAIKKDKKLVITAAAQAQKAADYIQGIEYKND